MHSASSGSPTALPPVLTYADACAALDRALAEVVKAREGATARALRLADVMGPLARRERLTPFEHANGEDPAAYADVNTAVRIANAAKVAGDARRAAHDLAEREDAEEVGRRILAASGYRGPRLADVMGEEGGPCAWLSLYRVELRDGGPEEGGWFWTRRELVASVKRSGILRLDVDEDARTSPADADARAALASMAEAHGLTLAGHFITRPDGSTRPARGYRSAAPEVDAELIPERILGESAVTRAPSYE